MARPKGVIQKRDESKYWLPEDVELVDDLGNPNYRKDTKLTFLDPIHGVFESTFKALQDAKASTHPKAVQERRKSTNIEKYGHENPGANKEVRAKAKKTMLKRYGVEHALQSPEFLEKSQSSLMNSHGVKVVMDSLDLKSRIKSTNLDRYGVDNIAKCEKIQNKIKNTNMERYGTYNPSKSSIIKERILKTRTANEKTGSSKGEQELRKFIESFGIETKKSYIGGANPKEIDIKVPSLNLAFEYNGAYYHSEKFLGPDVKKYHLDKTDRCAKKGIKLLHFFDVEWETRKPQIKSFLRSLLQQNSRRVYARKCSFVKVSKSEAKDFLNRYHILGAVGFKYCYGLEYKGELLALITLGAHHRGTGELVLSRYVGKEDVTVLGGLSKLCKNAYKLHGDFITWVDRRISDGENWINCGWKSVSTLKPDYFYINSNNGTIVSKQSRKKKTVNTPEGMTEREHAYSDGLFRVYDCGKIKMIYSGNYLN